MADSHTSRRRLAVYARGDKLIESSFFLMLSTGTMAGLGFLFWVIVARLYPPEQVGLATTLVSAATLISYFSLFCLNGTVVRFYGSWADRNVQISRALVLVALTGMVICAGYLLLVPAIAPELRSVARSPLSVMTFVVLGAAGGLNLLTDGVFVAARQARYNALVDGLLQGAVKVALPLPLVALGAFGIFAATGVAAVVAVAASLFLMRRRTGFVFALRCRGSQESLHLGYSASGYVSSILNLAPLMVIPLVVLDRLGPAPAGYYFVTFQIANLLYAISYAVGEAVFAEASAPDAELTVIVVRSARILAALQVPGVLVVAVGAPNILNLFGAQYSATGADLLIVLAFGAVTVALNTWCSFLLKVTRKMVALVLSNVVFAVSTIGLAWWWIPSGLPSVGWAWLLGNLASGLIAAVALLRSRVLRRATAPEKVT